MRYHTIQTNILAEKFYEDYWYMQKSIKCLYGFCLKTTTGIQMTASV